MVSLSRDLCLTQNHSQETIHFLENGSQLAGLTCCSMHERNLERSQNVLERFWNSFWASGLPVSRLGRAIFKASEGRKQ